MPLFQSSTVAVGNSTVNATGLSISNTLIANDVGLLVGTNTALVSVNSTAIKVGNSTVNNFVVNATGIYTGNSSGVQWQTNTAGSVNALSGWMGSFWSNSTQSNCTVNNFYIGTSSIQANQGYCRLPGGMLMQWGTAPANTSAPAAYNLPVAYATLYSFQAFCNNSASVANGSYANTTQVVLRTNSTANPATQQVCWITIGI